MNKKYLSVFVLIVVIVVAGILSSKPKSTDSTVYKFDKLGAESLVFEYNNGPEGYVLEEQDVSTSGNPDLLKSVTLTPTDDYKDQQNRVGGEASPSWNLSAYSNNLNQSASVWVESNPPASNINLMVGEAQEIIVAGANAVAYTIDGLYRTDMVVIASGGIMFVASSSYLDETSQTKRDFSSWIESFNFIPSEDQIAVPPGKIDVNVACNSALTYTTFLNGDDADKFIAECVEGKHPDIIERYIKDMGLDGARI